MTALVRYHGGKVRMAPKIVGLFPSHEAYVEPFGGGGAVLIEKPRSRLEVYNDLDGEMVSLFRVLRDHGDDLARAVALTPFARSEHVLSYKDTDDDIERARRTLVKSHFGHGSNGIHQKTGFRAAGLRAGTLPVHIWARFPETVARAADRLRGVVIEQRPAVDVMLAHDGPDTLHYVDPPYLPETRGGGADYRHEMSERDHHELLAVLCALRGRVVLSGYASRLYGDALSRWRRIDLRERADRALPRTEVLWLNFDDVTPLFGGAA